MFPSAKLVQSCTRRFDPVWITQPLAQGQRLFQATPGFVNITLLRVAPPLMMQNEVIELVDAGSLGQSERLLEQGLGYIAFAEILPGSPEVQ